MLPLPLDLPWQGVHQHQQCSVDASVGSVMCGQGAGMGVGMAVGATALETHLGWSAIA